MIDINKMLIVNVVWLKHYESKDEWVAGIDNKKVNFKYLKNNPKDYPFECLNFKLQENIYKGYFPDKNNPIDLNFKKLRIVDNDNEARGYTVVFVSKKPRKPGMWITGFYLNSTILRKMKYSDHHKCQPNIGRKEQPYRVWTDDKKSSCIKNENTRLEENINKPNRFIGRTTILYPDFRGKNGEQRRKLFERVKKFIEKQIQK